VDIANRIAPEHLEILGYKKSNYHKKLIMLEQSLLASQALRFLVTTVQDQIMCYQQVAQLGMHLH
jgi:histidinol dehydrogenase